MQGSFQTEAKNTKAPDRIKYPNWGFKQTFSAYPCSW